MRLKNKIAIVTGGSRGIGEQIVKRFVEEGATVFTGDKRQPTYDLPAGATHVDLDVTTEAGWKDIVSQAISKHGRIDILVNNAGYATFEPLLEVKLDDWHKAIALHMTGQMLGMQNVIPHMIKQGGGSIINFSSLWGIRAVPGVFTYQAVKGAVRHMTKAAAMTHVGDGIRVNSLHPGITDTPLVNNEMTQEAIDATVNATPMKRLGKPVEIANGVVFLASDEASYVTGLEMSVDGGSTI